MGRQKSRAAEVIAVSALLLGGLLIVCGLVARFGWRSVVESISSVGVGGFAVFCGYTLLLFPLLGSAWFVLSPEFRRRHFLAIVFGRLAREAAADILPLAQAGGFLAGARAATLLGTPAAAATASSLVDLGTELVGQLLYTAAGAAIIHFLPVSRVPRLVVDPMLALGLVGGVATTVLFLGSQKRLLHLLSRLAARLPTAMQSHLAATEQALVEIHARPLRLLSSIVLHLLAWFGGAGGVWLLLWFMGAPLSLPAVVAMESLIYLLRSAAFLAPGALGVLEGGYVLLGPMFGLSPELALALALIKRARDIAIGAPVVLGWQALEGRRLLQSRAQQHSTELNDAAI